jgi:hypothetical protein
MRKKHQNDAQLSLFESNELPEPAPTPVYPTPTTPLEFVKARFERGPDMTPEEYKRWIKILINISVKRME